MPEPDFDALGRTLAQAGVAPRHARRTVLELREHFADLRDELAAQGFDADAAETEASRQLGPLDVIAELVSARPELRGWPYRYPQLGRIALPLAYVLMLPVLPIMAGVSYAPAIARWGAIASLSAVITAGMFLAIQLSITLG